MPSITIPPPPGGKAAVVSVPGTTPAPTTAPVTTVTPTTKPAPTGPTIASFSVTADACPPKADPVATFQPPPSADPNVHMSWKITGPVDEVYDAVDDVNGPYTPDLKASGSATFSRACDGNSHTYYIVAVYKGHKTVKSKAVAGQGG
ncbi:MAG TPA: hypothetical protein VGM78_14095 [Ilumatobacteraceae bacterium]